MGLGMVAPVRVRVFKGGGITWLGHKLCAVRDLLLLCCVRVCVCALVCLIVVAFSRDCTNLLLLASVRNLVVLDGYQSRKIDSM